jgi:ABC-type branched-subunit amino acid transport system ATPase component
MRTEAKRQPQTDAAQPALEVTGISKHFGSLVAVANVSLSVPQGRIHGLIGPNGAGKTTLFNVVSGFIEPDAGQVRLFGAASVGVPARNRIRMGVARTFQHVAIYSQLSLLDNVVIGLGDNGVLRGIFGSFGDALQGREQRRREDLAKAALDVVGLYGRRSERAGTLALGDQRRLEIARAIASRPRLLLLDEPVSGVAIDEERRLKDLLHALNTEWSLTMLLIEHNIRFVVDCCSSLSVMHQGAIVVEGRPDQVIARKDVQEIYFGKV